MKCEIIWQRKVFINGIYFPKACRTTPPPPIAHVRMWLVYSRINSKLEIQVHHHQEPRAHHTLASEIIMIRIYLSLHITAPRLRSSPPALYISISIFLYVDLRASRNPTRRSREVLFHSKVNVRFSDE